MDQIFLSIIVCTLNRKNELLKCLEELARQVSEFNDVEVIVVDNGSTDGTEEVVQRFASIVSFPCYYVQESLPGPNAARNSGRAKARGKILAYIDDDAIPWNDWVRKIREHFLAGISDCLAGRVELRLEAPLPEWFPENLLWVLGKSRFGNTSRMMRSDETPQSGNCAMKAEVFDLLGGFDTSLRLYCDEVEFFCRVNDSGFTTMYRSDIVVDHYIPKSRLTKGALRRKAYMMGQGAATVKTLYSPNPLNRLRWAVKHLFFISYLSLACLVRPRFDREFTLYFNLGYLSQILK